LPKYLIDLSARHTKLKDLPSEFPVDLESLDLSFNCLTGLPKLPTDLSSLFLLGCNLKQVPKNLPSYLEVLDLSYNSKITEIKNVPTSVSTLMLDSTGISVINVKHLEDLICLSLNNTKVTDISVSGLPNNIEELHLNSNKITVIPADLPKYLRILYLNGTNVSVIPQTLPEYLGELYLENTLVNEINIPIRSLDILFLAGTRVSEEEKQKYRNENTSLFVS